MHWIIQKTINFLKTPENQTTFGGKQDSPGFQGACFTCLWRYCTAYSNKCVLHKILRIFALGLSLAEGIIEKKRIFMAFMWWKYAMASEVQSELSSHQFVAFKIIFEH